MVGNGVQEGEVVLTRPLRRARCVRGACVVGCTERGASASAVGAIWGGGGWGSMAGERRGHEGRGPGGGRGGGRGGPRGGGPGARRRLRAREGAVGGSGSTSAYTLPRMRSSISVTCHKQIRAAQTPIGPRQVPGPGWPMDHRTTTTVAIPGWHPLYKPPSPTVPFGVRVT